MVVATEPKTSLDSSREGYEHDIVLKIRLRQKFCISKDIEAVGEDGSGHRTIVQTKKDL